MVSASSIEELASKLRGALLKPGDVAFEKARSIWNGMVQKTPSLIVQCRGVADVITSVNFARTEKLPLAIKGGGHNVAGKAICDGGVVLDMSPMNNVRIDPVQRRAYAGAGALWADFDHEAQAFGLTCTGGVVSSTGVAGLTLGGGIGYLTRTHGLACDNLTGADVVTADGRLVHTDEIENPDLLWALRGGGGNFGVVTSLEFKLHKVGPMVASAMVFYSIDDAADVLRQYREFASRAPDEVVCYAMIVNAPPDFPDEHQGKTVLALVGCSSDAVDKGLSDLTPLGEIGEPIVRAIQATPYTTLQTTFDAGSPSGARYYWKTQHLHELTDDLLDTVVRFASDLHGDFTIIGIEQLGGACGRVANSATAYAHRGVPFGLGIWTGWAEPEQDRANIAWTQAFFDAVRPYGAGVYVNYLDGDEGDRVKEAYGENFSRLLEIKQKWDPTNLFKANQNIRAIT